MMYREIMAVCSEIHTKHINTLCGENVELLNVKPTVLVVLVVPLGFKSLRKTLVAKGQPVFWHT